MLLFHQCNTIQTARVSPFKCCIADPSQVMNPTLFSHKSNLAEAIIVLTGCCPADWRQRQHNQSGSWSTYCQRQFNNHIQPVRFCNAEHSEDNDCCRGYVLCLHITKPNFVATTQFRSHNNKLLWMDILYVSTGPELQCMCESADLCSEIQGLQTRLYSIVEQNYIPPVFCH
jgi:hypothetical protein